MRHNGTFTFTIGHPIQLNGFKDGAAVSWAQDREVRQRIQDEVEGMFDVFCDGTYPYEDFYKYVECGFLKGVKEAETVNEVAANWAGLEVIASLSAPHRLDLEQDERKVTASYLEEFKDYPAALQFLSQAGIPVDTDETLNLSTRMIGSGREKKIPTIPNFSKGSA